MKAIKMDHAVDPREAILEDLGDISGVELFFNSVLVAIYTRPTKTASGIYLGDKTREEDLYQGKAALVIKKGPRAFVDDGSCQFHGQNVDVGDWIAVRPSEGWSLIINKVQCRILQDVHIKARIPSPDVIF